MSKVSVIVPVYNVEKYLKRCLDSLINQTLSDIEIIAVNDGSTDKSRDILKEYKKKYGVKVLDKENGGLSDARNYGIPYATGEYIAFLDSDDYVELEMYEKMYSLAIKSQSDMVECDFFWEYPNRSKIDDGAVYRNKSEMLIFARVVAWNKLIKKSVLDEAKVRFPRGLRYEDVEFYFKMVPLYNKISFVKEPLVHYVQRSESISNNQNEKNAQIFEVFDNVFQYYKDNNIFEEYRKELEYAYARFLLCSSLFRMVKIKDRATRKKLLKATWENLNSKFPNWRKNLILKQYKSQKNTYMKTVNKFTYKLYCFLFRIIKR